MARIIAKIVAILFSLCLVEKHLYSLLLGVIVFPAIIYETFN